MNFMVVQVFLRKLEYFEFKYFFLKKIWGSKLLRSIVFNQLMKKTTEIEKKKKIEPESFDPLPLERK